MISDIICIVALHFAPHTKKKHTHKKRHKKMAARICAGRGKGKLLNLNGYLYEKNKVRSNKIHWRCVERKCRAPLQTELFTVQNTARNITILKVFLSVCIERQCNL